MDLQGKIIAVLPERSGTNARGDWKAQDFVVETIESYPKKMVFSVWGSDRLQRFNIQLGQLVNVAFDIDAHEYNGRWFNSIRAYDVRIIDPANLGMPIQQSSPQGETAAVAGGDAQTTSFPPVEETSEDDLPF